LNRRTFTKRKVTRNYKLVNCEFPKAKAVTLVTLLIGCRLAAYKKIDISSKNWVN